MIIKPGKEENVLQGLISFEEIEYKEQETVTKLFCGGNAYDPQNEGGT